MTLSLLPLFILVKTFEKGSQRGVRIIQDNRDTVSGKKKKHVTVFSDVILSSLNITKLNLIHLHCIGVAAEDLEMDQPQH